MPGTVPGPGDITRNKEGNVLVLSFRGVSIPEEKFIQSFYISFSSMKKMN